MVSYVQTHVMCVYVASKQTESSLESDEKKTNFKLVEFNIPSKIENSTKRCTPTVAEISLPWHRCGTKNGTYQFRSSHI